MKLDEKISDRKVVYLFRKDPAVAFELAMLYYIQAKRKKAREKIADACHKSLYWLKEAAVTVPEYLKQLSCFSQLEEIEKLLVQNRAIIDARLTTETLSDFEYSERKWIREAVFGLA